MAGFNYGGEIATDWRSDSDWSRAQSSEGVTIDHSIQLAESELVAESNDTNAQPSPTVTQGRTIIQGTYITETQ